MKIKSSYVCTECALSNGAKAVEGHACTTHLSPCPYCKKEKYLAHTSDWNWPKKKVLELGREL